jgi:hypothetical protein
LYEKLFLGGAAFSFIKGKGMTDIWWLVTQFEYFLASYDKVVGLRRLTVGPPDGEMSGVMMREDQGQIRAIHGC